jgi:hypothetical protein
MAISAISNKTSSMNNKMMIYFLAASSAVFFMIVSLPTALARTAITCSIFLLIPADSLFDGKFNYFHAKRTF